MKIIIGYLTALSRERFFDAVGSTLGFVAFLRANPTDSLDFE